MTDTDPLGADSAAPPRRTAWEFFRRGIPFTLVVNTCFAIVFAMNAHSWGGFHKGLVISHSIGFAVLSLMTIARSAVLPRLNLHPFTQVAVYGLVSLIGVPSGWALGNLLLGHKFVALLLALNANWPMILTFALIGCCAAIIYFRDMTQLAQRQRQTEQAERAALEAQLRALQAQIEPHFLFNTLATLDALIATDAPRARELLGHLIKYLRSALTHSRSEIATLANEVDMLNAYLSIMHQRMPNRLQTEVQCDARCAALEFPPMLLQPLVENAITHGIEPVSAGGTVRILARCEQDALIIDVEDTGAGLHSHHHPGSGAGTANIRARLASLYGDSASLTLADLPPTGTRATLYIPLVQLERRRRTLSEHAAL